MPRREEWQLLTSYPHSTCDLPTRRMNRTRRCNNRISILITFMVFFCAPRLFAQSIPSTDSAQGGFWATWFQRSDKTKQEQPHWITPLATTTPRLDQEFHYDVSWQQAKPGTNYTVNVGNSKGLELIPFEKIQINAGVLPYIVHNNPTVQDGFGDFRMLIKYRLLSANETNGNYIVTAFLDLTAPTGQHGNGQTNTILTPVIGYGKGFGHFDVQGTLGVALPTSNESTAGRTYTWNNAFQYQLLRRLWPELEVNATFFQDGNNDGRKQVLITPGLIVGRLPLTSRLSLVLGAGVQIAASEFHTTQHNFILTVRLPF